MFFNYKLKDKFLAMQNSFFQITKIISSIHPKFTQKYNCSVIHKSKPPLKKSFLQLSKIYWLMKIILITPKKTKKELFSIFIIFNFWTKKTKQNINAKRLNFIFPRKKSRISFFKLTIHKLNLSICMI